jgi:spore maturation protein CgeB
MEAKLRYCGAKIADFWPLASFDTLCDPSKTEMDILSSKRDIDVVFIGALYLNKMPLLAKVTKALGSKLFLRGISNFKKNLYFNLKYGFPCWVRPLPFEDYVPIYQRAKIGINIHNRGDYTVGSYRLFDLPANGVMQISDGGTYLNHFFTVGEEIESYRDANELFEKIYFYLSNDKERERIALNGFRRVLKDYKITKALHQAYKLIKSGINRSAYAA